MAKDPAVLFYTADFIVATMTMTMEQRGKYITLLCMQHQQGFLTEEDLKNVLEDTDIRIFSKFEKQSDGYFYNIRLKQETERRKNYSESRRKNLMSKHKNSHMGNNMNSHLETGTGTGTGTKAITKAKTKTEIKTGNETSLEYQELIDNKESKAVIDKFDNLFSDIK
jgi:hypothetical protein